MGYSKFLSPAKIGTLELKNRAIMPAMGSSHGEPGGIIGQGLIDYHVRRAQGGCAMNIVEIASVHPTSYATLTPGIFDDKFLPGLTKLATSIKEAGGKACIQLWHGGRQTSGQPFQGQPWASSAIPCPMIGEVPHEMTLEEVHEVIESFGDAAVRAKKAGFDAVEIHGAHGYLIDCFLNAYSNHRTDEYGGSLENRARFGCEVIRNVRSKVGKDYPVLIRMNASENVPGGNTIEEQLQVAEMFVAEGVDALDISQGCYGAIPYTVPPYFLPMGVNVENAAVFKKRVNVPILVAGRITNPDMAEKILEEEKADFICLGRVQLADPDFVKKTEAGCADEIVRCVACDQGCVGRAFAGLGVSCIFNPATGNEANVIITPAKEKKKVLVIGGGPAGLEAARVASERGHEVTLFEKSVKLGGQFLIAGSAPYKEGFTESAIHMGYRAQKAGVDIRLYTEASKENIQELNPDVVIVATGSEPAIPPIPGVDRKHVYEARSVIGGEKFVREKNIVVIGGGLVGLEAAEILIEQGKKAAIVEMQDEIGKDLEMYIRPYYAQFTEKNKMETYTNSICKEIGEKEVLIETNGVIKKLECDAVIIATGSKSNQAVVEILKEMDYEYHVIGDALKPSKVLDAIWAGNEVARNL